MMHEEGQIDPAAQAETGATFARYSARARPGSWAPGNFNITLVTGAEGIEGQNPDMDFGITLIPGLNTGDPPPSLGGDIVVVPQGQ